MTMTMAIEEGNSLQNAVEELDKQNKEHKKRVDRHGRTSLNRAAKIMR